MDVQEVREGKAKVLLPKSVFYNPVQEFNRDLTTCLISQFAEEHLAELAQKAADRENRKSQAQGTKTDTAKKDNAQAQEAKSDATKKGKVQETKIDAIANKDVPETNSDNNTKRDRGDSDCVNELKETKDCSKPAGDEEEMTNAEGCKPDIKDEVKGIKILEGLAASGLRSVRFGLEIPLVKEVVANDFDKGAVEFIEKNIQRNNLEGRVKASCADAKALMLQNSARADQFDVIDLDPYGSASVFLDTAVQAVCDGGLLCITCTDAAVLCGKDPETCLSSYNCVSLKSRCCHEMGLRILLRCVDSHANVYSRYIVPLLSVSVDFYMRVFVRVYTSPKTVKLSSTKASKVYVCKGCGSFALQPLVTAIPTKGDNNFKFVPGVGPAVGRTCEHCGHRHDEGGPVWSAPMHDAEFVGRVLERLERDGDLFSTSKRMKGLLTVIREELSDVPLHYVSDAICNVLHCTPPSMMVMRSALLNAGYRVSCSHSAKNSYKTDAPASVIWDIMRCWVQQHPVNSKRLTDGSVAKAILDKPPKLQASFELHPDSNPASRQKGLVRYQPNPQPNWGPKPRAKRAPETQNSEMAGDVHREDDVLESNGGAKRKHEQVESAEGDELSSKEPRL